MYYIKFDGCSLIIIIYIKPEAVIMEDINAIVQYIYIKNIFIILVEV